MDVRDWVTQICLTEVLIRILNWALLATSSDISWRDVITFCRIIIKGKNPYYYDIICAGYVDYAAALWRWFLLPLGSNLMGDLVKSHSVISRYFNGV